jgi:hypothetical protein
VHRVFPITCPHRRVGRIAACLIGCALLCVLPVFAQSDEAPPADVVPTSGVITSAEDRLNIQSAVRYHWKSALPESSPGFWDERFLPAVEHRMSHLSAIHLQRSVSGSLTDDLFYDIATHEARRGLERATRMAFETMLLEETSIGRLHDRIVNRANRVKRETSGEGGGKSRFDFDLGISHSLPRFEMSYSLDKADLNLRVDYDGLAQLEFRPLNTRSRVWARYDPWDDRYSLGCRLEF